MTIALGKFTKDENDLFDIMDDWLRRDRFVFVGWSGQVCLMWQSGTKSVFYYRAEVRSCPDPFYRPES